MFQHNREIKHVVSVEGLWSSTVQYVFVIWWMAPLQMNVDKFYSFDEVAKAKHRPSQGQATLRGLDYNRRRM